MAAAGVGGERLLTSLSREDARNVRDYLLRDLDMTPATARRYLNDVRALVTFGLLEHDLQDQANPFLSLPIKLDTTPVEDRDPIPENILPAIRGRMQHHAGVDLWRIW